MRHLKEGIVTGLVLVLTSSAGLAQRAVNTGGGTASKAMELGVDVGSLSAGLEDPKYIRLNIGGQGLVRMAWFISNNMAFEPALGWVSRAQENTEGTSSYAVDLGFLYGLGSMAPNEKPFYVRPSVMLTGGSAGVASTTTITGAFGMRRMFKGVIMRNEIVLLRTLEDPATTTLQLRHGISVRKQ